MPQETNLNVAPYFDDFDPESNYNKVLFKPAYPVQARELNSLQSILQDQIESMGDNLFKEGAMIIPGQLTYNDQFHCVQIQDEFLGVPVSLYLDQLVGKTITGRDSGVTATVVTYITNEQSVRNTYTLYVNYIESADDNSTEQFSDNEVLVVEESIEYLTTFIASNEGFATTLATESAQIGSAFILNNGVYYLRGHFVNVEDQILILDQYSTDSSYRVGLLVKEEIVSSDVDPNLNDNAQGFSNFTAPGADRLKITATLAKKNPDDFDDQGFVQLADLSQGEIRDIVLTTKYNAIGDEMAKRTFDESGNYYIKEFVTTCRESLNNFEGNRGIFNPGQTTARGSTPSDDLMVYKVSPGKAYVRGYEVNKRSSTLLDVAKPRTTRLIKNQGINFGFGPTFAVNRVYGQPTIGINTSTTISLRDQRVGSDQTVAPGTEIGKARLYDFALESGFYNNTNANTNQWDLTLWDVNTYTTVDFNVPATLTIPVHVKGESSGAKAFLKDSITSASSMTLYDVQGDFLLGERLEFDGILDDSRFVTGTRKYGVSDVKSVHSVVAGINTFTADIVQERLLRFDNSSITASSLGVSTITSPALGGRSWVGLATVGNLVRYSRSGLSDKTLNRITEVTTSQLTVQAVENVTGICNGGLPSAVTEITDLEIVGTKFRGTGGSGNQSSTSTIYSVFPKRNIESVDLDNANIVVRQKFDVAIDATGKTNLINVDQPNLEVFLPFDEERYTLVKSNGTTEILTEDKFTFSNGSASLTINGLSGADPNCLLTATIRKSNVTSKVKSKNISNSLLVRFSAEPASGTNVGTADTTLDDGLRYGNFPYGTRVQDEEICLNVPDVIRVFGVFESENTSDPEAPNMTTSNMNGPTASTNDIIIGESVTGQRSGAKAIYINRKSDTSINFVYLNETTFESGETINFSESGVSATAADVKIGSINRTQNYQFIDGQRGGFYDYARLVRRGDASAPTRKLMIYFSNAFYNTADDGDITTVNSYDALDYGVDIAKVDGVRLTDIIDARPRVSDYEVVEGGRSPFEFNGRVFDGGQHSSKRIVAQDESITVDYNYYLPRADRIYLDQNGVFNVKKGSPDDIPHLPTSVSNGVNIANVFLPAYLYNVNNAKVSFIDHKRYQMSDISKLETRIKNLEYYSSLNLLEQSTFNTFVPDTNGLNRFKSGIYVDNFTSMQPQDTSIGIKNSLDVKKKILRPAHYTTAFNLQLGSSAIPGIGSTTDANADSRFADVAGIGIRRSGNIVTLDWQDTSWLAQPFATRVQSVTPFLNTFYAGNIELDPTADIWIDTNRLEPRNVTMEGTFQGIAEALGADITSQEDGTRVGVTPVMWDSWETTGVNISMNSDTRTQQLQAAADDRGVSVEELASGEPPPRWGLDIGQSTVDSTFVSSTISLDQTRSGTQQTINEVINTESLGENIVSRDIIHFMRSRNVSFTGTRLKPYTQVYAFFDGVDVTRFCVPKLIQITMQEGSFQVGETVRGRMVTRSNEVRIQPILNSPAIEFRLATPNHKYGPYNDPSDFYDSDPYAKGASVPESYSEASSLLNVDEFTLQSEEFPEFAGYIQTGMILIGQSSGAVAVVSDLKHVTDRVGTIIGSFRVPNGNNLSNPTFETGRNTFKLTSSPINSRIKGTATTSAEEIFYSQGDVDNTQETTLSLRNASVVTDQLDNEVRTLTDETGEVLVETDVNVVSLPRPRPVHHGDPLAQTFKVDDPTGIFVTKCDIFFQSKSDNLPIAMEIRETTMGTPNDIILPFSHVVKDPKDIDISQDGKVATTFEYSGPVYLKGNTEYAIVLLSNSTDYNVWISRLGEPEISTAGQEAGQILVTTQPLMGSLFKSQNASAWTASQYEDLKFTLYRADFGARGSLQFFNPQLSTDLETITRNGLLSIPRKISIGLSTAISASNGGKPIVAVGNRIIQANSDGRGRLVGIAGSATGSLSVTKIGIGYTPASGNLTFTGVGLTAVTGNGINATANIVVNNGSVTSATIVNGGTGFQVGDVVAPLAFGFDEVGRGAQFSIQNLGAQNELILEDVQGTFGTSAGNAYLEFSSVAGVNTSINAGIGGSVFALSPIRVDSREDGLHMKIFQRNHGMYSQINRCNLRNIETNIAPTALTAAYTSSETGNISIIDATNFTEFENVGVSNTNPGYVRIGDEIIEYTGVSGNNLIGITSRGLDSTREPHSVNDLVYKYEYGGVSLRRINKQHNFADVTVPNPIEIDSYHVKIDMSKDGVDRSESSNDFGANYFNTRQIGGGVDAKGTYNLPFSMITPTITSALPAGTNLSGNVRTVSETSVSGPEVSYVDQGTQDISLVERNYFPTQRMVVSKANEDVFLTSLPGRKSFGLGVELSTFDNRLTPSIDLEHSSVLFTSNRVNAPINDYANDPRINTILLDPNSLMYVTKNIVLENPATSLTVYIDAYVSNYNDIRLFYSLNQDKPAIDSIFTPFPGHENLDTFGQVINPDLSDGKSDKFVRKIDTYTPEPSLNLFKEHTFTIDNLEPFSSFRIKLLGTSTNQAIVPQFRNLRVIALA